jgi:ADP-ribose diphosphatase
MRLPWYDAWKMPDYIPGQRTGSDYIFRGRALNLRVDKVLTPAGRETTREIVEHDQAVVIVAVDHADLILMVRQYREAVDEPLLEIPAGGIDAGETPEAAVRREMREETGYSPKTIRRLGGFYSTPGFCTEYLHLYLATELTAAPLIAEDSEYITLEKYTRKELQEQITSGAVRDAKSIAGLLIYFGLEKSPL